MRRQLRFGTIVSGVLVVAVAAVSGCGGGSSGPSEASFRKAWIAEKQSLTNVGTGVGVAIQTASKLSDSTIATEFGSLSTRGAAELARVRALRAPAKYRPMLTTLSTSLTRAVADLRAISVAAAAHDTRAARTATRALVTDSRAVRIADNGITSGLGLPLTR